MIKQLIKRAKRPNKEDIRRKRVPYEPPKAPPFSLTELLRMKNYCLQTIEASNIYLDALFLIIFLTFFIIQ